MVILRDQRIFDSIRLWNVMMHFNLSSIFTKTPNPNRNRTALCRTSVTTTYSDSWRCKIVHTVPLTTRWTTYRPLISSHEIGYNPSRIRIIYNSMDTGRCRLGVWRTRPKGISRYNNITRFRYIVRPRRLYVDGVIQKLGYFYFNSGVYGPKALLVGK